MIHMFLLWDIILNMVITSACLSTLYSKIDNTCLIGRMVTDSSIWTHDLQLRISVCFPSCCHRSQLSEEVERRRDINFILRFCGRLADVFVQNVNRTAFTSLRTGKERNDFALNPELLEGAVSILRCVFLIHVSIFVSFQLWQQQPTMLLTSTQIKHFTDYKKAAFCNPARVVVPIVPSLQSWSSSSFDTISACFVCLARPCEYGLWK